MKLEFSVFYKPFSSGFMPKIKIERYELAKEKVKYKWDKDKLVNTYSGKTKKVIGIVLSGLWMNLFIDLIYDNS